MTQKLVALLIGLTCATAAVLVLAAGGSGRDGRPNRTSTGTRRYVNSSGWSLAYPGTMSLERSDSGPGRVLFSEVTIASFPQQRAVHTGRTRDGGYVYVHPPLDPRRGFPRDGVAFRMLAIDGGPAPLVTVADSRFPIRLATFRRPRYPDYSNKGIPPSLDRQIYADGQRYAATVIVGPDASPRLRHELARVIASLSFPRLRPGTEVGIGLTVLQRADRYPVRSFTLVHARGFVCDRRGSACHDGHVPFYLVHAPGHLHEPDLLARCTPPASCSPTGAFYAIGWTWEDQLGGYRSSCHLRLDRRREQFYCTNLDARWNRVGTVITRPPGSAFGDPLQFAFAKIAWDGHVVMDSGIDESTPRPAAARSLWP